MQDDPTTEGDRSVIFSEWSGNGNVPLETVSQFLEIRDANGAEVDLDKLTSRGDSVYFELSNDGTILLALATDENGDERSVFRVGLSDDRDGSYEFILDDTLDHPIQGTSPFEEDPLSLIFTYTARDGDGDYAKNDFVVRVMDDSPIIGPADVHAFGTPVTSVYEAEDIPDGGLRIPEGRGSRGVTTSSLEVPEGGSILDLDVVMSFSHTFLSDLDITLIAPDGTRILLISQEGRFRDADGSPIELDDEASRSFDQAPAPFGGVWKPSEQALSNLDGLDQAGTWTLEFEDFEFLDTGFLFSWSLEIQTGVAAVVDEDDLSTQNGDLVDGIGDTTQNGDDDVITNQRLENLYGDGDPTVVFGNLGIAWGADNANDNVNGGATFEDGDRAVAFVDTTDAQDGTIDLLLAQGFSSGGTLLHYEITENGTLLTARAGQGGETVFTVTLFDTHSGWFKFDLQGNLDHPEGADENNLIIDFLYQAIDSDGDTAQVTFSIGVDDDVPVIGASEDQTVDEDDLPVLGNNDELAGDDLAADGSPVKTGNLAISWGSDSADSDDDTGSEAGLGDRSVYFTDLLSAVSNVTVTDSADNTLDLSNGELQSNGEEVKFHLLDNGQTLVGYVGTNAPAAIDVDSVVFSVELSDDGTGSYTFTLRQNLDHPYQDSDFNNDGSPETAFEDDLTFSFDFTAQDSDGDKDTSGSFEVTVDDDMPTTTGATGSVDETQLDMATGDLERGEELTLTSIGSLSDPSTAVFRIINPSDDAVEYSYRIAGDSTVYSGVAAAGLSFFSVPVNPTGATTVILSYDVEGTTRSTTKAADNNPGQADGDAVVPVGGTTGTIEFSLGADDQPLEDALVFDPSGLTGLQTTAGSNITVTFVDASAWPLVEGRDENGDLAFELFVRPNGSWSFTQQQALAHGDASDPDDPIELDFVYTITDTDGDSVSDSIEITVYDDGPVIGASEDQTVDEDDLPVLGNNDELAGDDLAADGSPVKTGNLAISWGSDSADSDDDTGSEAGLGDRSVYFTDLLSAVSNVTVTDSADNTLDLSNGELQSNGEEVKFHLLDNGQTLVGYVGTNAPAAIDVDSVVFSVELSDDGTGSYTFTLRQNLDHPYQDSDFNNDGSPETAFEDDLTFSFDFTAQDSDGDKDTSGSFEVTVDDDMPTTTGATGSVDETQLDMATGDLERGEELTLTSIGSLSDPSTAVFRIINPSDDAVEYSYRIAGDSTVYSGVAAAGLSFFSVPVNPTGATTVILSYDVEGTTRSTTKAADNNPGQADGDAVVPVGGTTGTIEFSLGADDQPLEDALVFDPSGLTGLQTTAGSNITVTFVDASAWPLVEGRDENGDLAFELFVRPNGSWSFTQQQALAHGDASDPDDPIELDFVYTITDTDGDSVSDSIEITVYDDGPVIGASEDQTVDEDDLPVLGNNDELAGDDLAADGSPVKTGNLAISWGSDSADSDDDTGSEAGLGDRSVYFTDLLSAVSNVTVTDSADNTLDLSNGELQSNGEEVKFHLLDNGQTLVGYVGTNAPAAIDVDSVVFSVELSDDGTGSYTFTLRQNLDHPYQDSDFNNDGSPETAFEDDLTFSFDFTAQDSDGDKDTSGSFEVTVDDDMPTTTGATGSVDETQLDMATGDLERGEELTLTSIGSLSDPSTAVFRIINPSDDAVEYSYRIAGDSTVYSGVAAAGLSFFSVPVNPTGATTVILSYDVEGTTRSTTKAADNNPGQADGDAVVPVGGTTGTIEFSLGADDQPLEDALVFDPSGLTGLQTTAGSNITVTFVDASAWPLVEGRDENGDLAFELFVRPNGSWSFTQQQALAHGDASDPDDPIELDFVYTITDTDGDSVSDSIEITVYDDGPVIGASEDQTVDEDDLPVLGNNDELAGDDLAADGSPVKTGNLAISWGSDSADSDDDTGSEAGLGDRSVYFTDLLSAVSNVTVTDSADNTLDLSNGELQSNGEEVKFHLLDNGQTLVGYVGTNAPAAIDVDSVVFSVELSDDGTGSYTFTLRQNLDHPYQDSDFNNDGSPETAFEDDLTFSFDFTAQDSDGDKDTSGSFEVTVDDDMPTTTGATGSVDETQLDMATGDLERGEELTLTSIGSLSDPSTAVFRIINPSDDAVEYSYRIAGDSTVYSGVAAAGLSFFSVPVNPTGATTVILSYDVEGTTRSTTKAADNNPGQADGDAVVPVGGTTGTIEFSLGADDQPLEDALVFDPSGLTGLQTTAGSNITVTFVDASAWPLVEGRDENGDLAFELFVRPNGSWSFTQQQALAHGDASDPDDPIELDFVYTITDTDGDSVSDSIEITVYDDGPVIGASEDQTVDEDDLPVLGNNDELAGDDLAADGSPVKTGNLAISWGSDSADSDDDTGSEAGLGDRSVYFTDLLSAVSNVTVTDSADNTLDLSNGELQSNGEEVKFHLLDNGQTLVGYVGTNAPAAIDVDSVVFSVELSDDGTGSYTFTLRQNLDHPYQDSDFNNDGSPETAFEDDLTFSFDFTAQDSDGDKDTSGSFEVTVDDDMPTTTGATGSVDETQLDMATGDLERGEELTLTSIGSLSDPSTAVFRIINPSDDAVEYSYRIAGDSTVYSGVAAAGLSFFSVPVNPTGATTVILSYDVEGTTRSTTKAADNNPGQADGDAVVPVGGTTGTIEFSLGADDQPLEDALVFDPSGLTGLQTTAGSNITVTFVDASAWPLVEGRDENGDLAFELFVRPNGSWSFTQQQALAHGDASDPDDPIELDFVYTITDTDGDSVSDSIEITVYDDGPVVGDPVAGEVSEDTTALSLLNDSFEAKSLASGEPDVVVDDFRGNFTRFQSDDPEGWTIDGEGGLFAPTDTISDPDGHAGDNVVWLRQGATLSQDSGEVLVEGANYTLSFNVGDRSDDAWPGGEARLVAVDGATTYVLAALDLPEPANGEWLEVSLDTGLIPAEYAGLDLRIEIQQDSTGGGDQILVDDVQLVRFEPSSDTQALDIDWGADDDVDLRSVEFDSDLEGATSPETSNGAAISYELSNDNTLLTATSADGRTIFTVELSKEGTGSYTFTLIDNLDHDGAGDDLSLDLVFGIEATDSDGDTAEDTITIAVNDDTPAAGTPILEMVSEDGVLSVEDADLGIEWGSDDGNSGTADRSVQFAAFTGSGLLVEVTDHNGADVSLTSFGEPVLFTVLQGVLVGYTGDEPGSASDDNVVLTASLSDLGSGSFSFELVQPLDHTAPNLVTDLQFLDLKIGYTATDSDGDITEVSSVTVTVDAAGEVSSIDYSGLTTGVFVNLAETDQTVDGQTVDANTATDRTDQGPIVGEDDVTGVNNATGGSEDDILVSGSGSNRLTGNEGDDTFVLLPDLIVGNGQTREIDLGDGTTRTVSIAGRAGTSDPVVGGTGFDELILNEGTGNGFVHDTFKAGTQGFISGIEKITGTDGDDVIIVDDQYMSDAADGGVIIEGGTGEDVLGGGKGDDEISGGADNDLISGLDGEDVLEGNEGRDEIFGGDDNDLIDGGADTDTAGYLQAITPDMVMAVADANPDENGDQAGWRVTTGGDEGTDNLIDVEIIAHADGNILLVGNGGFDTLQDAMDEAVDGDIIMLAPGTYTGDVTVDKAVSILGPNYGKAADDPTRTAEAIVDGEITITTTSGDVAIDGIKVSNDSGPTEVFYGITIDGAANVTVENSVFDATSTGGANGDRAIYLTLNATGSISINDNEFTGEANGHYNTNWNPAIKSDGPGINLDILNNAFGPAGSAIQLATYDDATSSISGNTMTKVAYGIQISAITGGPDLTSITNNDFSNVIGDIRFENVSSDINLDLGATGNTSDGTGGSQAKPMTIRMGSGNDTVVGTNGIDVISGNAGNDEITAGGDNDVVQAGAGDDTVIWNVGDGTDIVQGASDADAAADTDTFVVNGSGDTETFYVETVDDYDTRTGLGDSLDADTEIVVSRAVGGNPSVIVAELENIDDIDVNGGGGADNFVVSGDFTGTDLDPSTITLNGDAGGETFDVSGMSSTEQVVVTVGGGHDRVIGIGDHPNTVIVLSEPFETYTLTYNGDGTYTLADGGPNSVTFDGDAIFRDEDGADAGDFNLPTIVDGSVTTASYIEPDGSNTTTPGNTVLQQIFTSVDDGLSFFDVDSTGWSKISFEIVNPVSGDGIQLRNPQDTSSGLDSRIGTETGEKTTLYTIESASGTSFTEADLKEIIDNLRFFTDEKTPEVSPDRTVRIVVTDDGNGTAAPVESNAFDITVSVTGVNDTPTEKRNSSVTVETDEDTPITDLTDAIRTAHGGGLDPFRINDPDDDTLDPGGTPSQMTLTVQNGVLSFTEGSGLTIVSGDGTSTLIIQGTNDAMDDFINGKGSALLDYTPDENFNGSDELTFQVDDMGDQGMAAKQSPLRTVEITVNAVNDPTEITGTVTSVSYTEIDGSNDTTPGSPLQKVFRTVDDGLSLSDDDSSGWTKLTFEIGDAVAGDGLQLRNNDLNSTLRDKIGTETGEKTTLFVIEAKAGEVFSEADVKEIIDELRFFVDEKTPEVSPDRTLKITVTDNGDGTNPGVDSNTFEVTIGVTGVNDTPTEKRNSSVTVETDEDTPITDLTDAIRTAHGGGLDPFRINDPDDDTLDPGGTPSQMTLTVQNGVLSFTEGSGLTIVSGDGTSTLIIQGTNDAMDDFINGKGSALLDYTPDENFNGSDELTFQVDDMGDQGMAAKQSPLRTVEITVNAVNDPTEITGTVTSVSYTEIDGSNDTTPGSPLQKVFRTVDDGLSLSDDDSSGWTKLTFEIGDAVAGDGLQLRNNDLNSTLRDKIGTETGEKTTLFVIEAKAGEVFSEADVKEIIDELRFFVDEKTPEVSPDRTLKITVTDNGDGTNPGVDSNTFEVTIGVTGVNDTPTEKRNSSVTVETDEDTPITDLTDAIRTAHGGGLDPFRINDPDDDTLDPGGTPSQMTLTVQNGVLSFTEGSGLTIVSGDGTSTLIIQGTNDAMDDFINGKGSALLDYTPDENFNGSDELTFQVDDMGDQGMAAKQSPLRTVEITVNAVNDEAEIAGEYEGSVTEDDQDDLNDSDELEVSGELEIDDVDGESEEEFDPDSVVFASASHGDGSARGSLEIDEDGEWTYTIDNDLQSVQDLDEGESFTETFTVASVDGTEKDITVTVNGADEPSGSSLPTERSELDNSTPLDSNGKAFTWTHTITGNPAGGATLKILAEGDYSGKSSEHIQVIVDGISLGKFRNIGEQLGDGVTGTSVNPDVLSYSGSVLEREGDNDVAWNLSLELSELFFQSLFVGDGEIDIKLDNNVAVDKKGPDDDFFGYSLVYGGASDPIALDLNGDGVDLSASVAFDIDADGDLDEIGWVGPEDGLLVMDVDGSGAIEDGSEVFSEVFNGGSYADSLEALATLDSNGDGVIDANDAAFGDIKVWQDVNSDGITQEGELQTLIERGISAIDLEAARIDQNVDGNTVFAEGTYTNADGSTGTYVGVNFGAANDDAADSEETTRQSTAIAAGIALVLYTASAEEVAAGLTGINVKGDAASGTVHIDQDLSAIYSPAAGYSGPDAVELELVFADGTTVTRSIELEVLADEAAVTTSVTVEAPEVPGTEQDVADASDGVSGEPAAAAAAVTVTGSVIRGDDGDNILVGTDGDDILIGGLGSDTLTGGEGADTFVLNSLAEADIITDYTFGEGDKLDLGQLLDSAFGAAADAAEFVRAHRDANGEVRVEVDRDGGRDGEHDWQEAATLQDHASMGDTVRVVLDTEGTETNIAVNVA